jgi:SAM-dependent methyltransferase
VNLDKSTVEGFGQQWATYDQSALPPDERQELFNHYFSIFPFELLTPSAEGFDLGCGSGRWAAIMAPKVGVLHCIDPAPEALEVAKRNVPSAQFHLADAESIPIPDGSQDFGYSLGVLHHVPDPAQALSAAVRKLKTGAPFLLYLYYVLENRPGWYRSLWKVSDIMRKGISRLPLPLKKAVTRTIGVGVYWPLSRASRILGPNFPLHSYRNNSLYTLKTDAFDRFGTRLEQRFTKEQIRAIMLSAGLVDIRFSDRIPYWTAVGFRG